MRHFTTKRPRTSTIALTVLFLAVLVLYYLVRPVPAAQVTGPQPTYSPTQVPSTAPPAPTPTRSPSPSRSPHPSRTPTPTPSSSATPSASPSPVVSGAPSPTPSGTLP